MMEYMWSSSHFWDDGRRHKPMAIHVKIRRRPCHVATPCCPQVAKSCFWHHLASMAGRSPAEHDSGGGCGWRKKNRRELMIYEFGCHFGHPRKSTGWMYRPWHRLTTASSRSHHRQIPKNLVLFWKWGSSGAAILLGAHEWW